MGETTCPILCSTDADCPQSHSCTSDQCAPWPVGLVVPWGGETVPAGWLEANGAAVSRVEWSRLFAAIGTTYGAGDGSTTFNLPDLRGRFALGQTASGTGSKLGDRFGAIDHVHDVALGAHTHTLSVAAHSHALDALPPHAHHWYFSADVTEYPGPNQVFLMSQSGDTEPATGGPFSTSSDGSGELTTSSQASSAALQPATPPFLATRHLILAKTGAEPPCGAVWFQGRSSPPTGSQIANGTQVSRSANAWMFGCLKTAFGDGDGIGTFELPDLRGRAALGKATIGTGSKLGEVGGQLDHVHAASIDATAHSVLLPAHSHTAIEPSHAHSVIAPTPAASIAAGYMYGTVTSLYPTTDPATGTSATSSIAAATDLAVPAASVEYVQSGTAQAPFLVLQPVLFEKPSHRLAPGAIAAFAGNEVPFGWLVADGSAVSRTQHAGLFAAIGTTFGAGDGSTTFNLPDLRGRSAMGKADSGPAAQVGASGGSLDHAHQLIVPNHAHTVVFPAHTHQLHFPPHTHVLQHNQVLATSQGAPTQTARGVQVVVLDGGEADATSKQAAAATSSTSAAGGETVSTQPANAPHLVLRYIIHR